jgi:hypothetical protein
VASAHGMAVPSWNKWQLRLGSDSEDGADPAAISAWSPTRAGDGNQKLWPSVATGAHIAEPQPVMALTTQPVPPPRLARARVDASSRCTTADDVLMESGSDQELEQAAEVGDTWAEPPRSDAANPVSPEVQGPGMSQKAASAGQSGGFEHSNGDDRVAQLCCGSDAPELTTQAACEQQAVASLQALLFGQGGRSVGACAPGLAANLAAPSWLPPLPDTGATRCADASDACKAGAEAGADKPGHADQACLHGRSANPASPLRAPKPSNDEQRPKSRAVTPIGSIDDVSRGLIPSMPAVYIGTFPTFDAVFSVHWKAYPPASSALVPHKLADLQQHLGNVCAHAASSAARRCNSWCQCHHEHSFELAWVDTRTEALGTRSPTLSSATASCRSASGGLLPNRITSWCPDRCQDAVTGMGACSHVWCRHVNDFARTTLDDLLQMLSSKDPACQHAMRPSLLHPLGAASQAPTGEGAMTSMP